jgi:hypothetical protein
MARSDTALICSTLQPGWRGPSISRRVVLAGVSIGLAQAVGASQAAEGAFDGGGRPRQDERKAELSLVFLANARGFYTAAVAARDRFPRQAAQSLAIAIELALKSYLLHQGFSDDWNRVHIGHDLCRALSYAQRAGLHDIPPGLHALTDLLSPYYSRHVFHAMTPQALGGISSPSTQAVVGALQTVVGEAIRRDRLSRSMALTISDVRL